MVRAQDDEDCLPGGLIVGSYCHDVLFRDNHRLICGHSHSLGGAASFISNVLDASFISPSHYVSKVGPDFAYSNSISHPALLSSSSSPTTLFHAHFSSSSSTAGAGDRVLKRVRSCDPIYPSDLPDTARFDFGLAVGVAGEIPPETLARMLDLCRLVFVDAQALIRTFDPVDGTVGLVPLRDTAFYRLLPRIGFLKASAVEAPFVDVEEVRRWCCVVVTDGEHGCRVYWKDGEMQVPALPAAEVDPTGAGDSFLGGFVVGLIRGLRVQDAALLGNFFGSLTVGQIGIPKFDQRMLQIVRQEIERLTIQRGGLRGRSIAVDFRKSDKHEEFQVCLTEAAKLACTRDPGELDED